MTGLCDKDRLQGDWTKLTSKDCDIPGFIRRMEAMKRGNSTICPFCGGAVKLTAGDGGKSVFACDSCDMRIETEVK